MYYSGYFRNTDTSTDKAGQLFKVVIITNFKKEEFNYGGELMLTDSPFTVNYESEDGNIFKPYKYSTATVGILQENFNFEFSNTQGNNVLVMLLRFKNERKETEIKDSELSASYNKQLQIDNICYSVEWIGYSTPNTYSQEFENFYDGFELEAQDALSTLQYFPYSIRNIQNTYISFIDILQRYCTFTRAYKNIYITDNIHIPTNEDGDILNFCYIDQRNFFDEDETPKTALEVIEQLAMYLNVSVIPYGDSIYIVDYTGIRSNNNSYYHYKDSLTNIYPFIQKNVTDIDFFTLKRNKVILTDSHDIKETDFSSTGTKLSLLSTYNKLSVKDSLYSFGSISPNFEEKSRWGESKSEDLPARYDDKNIIIESGGKYVSEYFTDANNSEHQYLREWVDGGFTPKKRIDEDKYLTVIGNTRKNKNNQKVYIKFLEFKQSDSLFNNSELTTYWYNKDYKDTNGIWHFGSSNPSINENKNWCYNTLRNYCGAQFIAYHTETVDDNKRDLHPLKLELKPAILISTPSEFTWKNYVENYSSTLQLLQPMFKVKSKSVCLGSGDYIVISWKQKCYKDSDCLPISVEETDDVDLGANQYIGVSLNGHDYFYEYIGGSMAFPFLFKSDGKKAFGSNLELSDLEDKYNFKDKLGIEEGIVIPARLSDTENSVEVGDIEVTFYRPFGGKNNIPVKCTLIEDFKVEVITKSDLNGYMASDDDTDTEYSNVIDEEAVEEKSNVELDVTTWDNKQPNYSSVVYSEKLNLAGNNIFGKDLGRIRHIYNKATGEILRAEEHIINNNVVQYSTPTLSLNLNLHIKPLPYSLFTYHFFKDRIFIVDGCELNYMNNSYNMTLTEKK